MKEIFKQTLGSIICLAMSYSAPLLGAFLPPAQSTQTMIASEQALATQVGLKILKQGGNAIDAAVAIGYALAVVQPCCGNIGGGGFMLIHLANDKNVVINFREKAPAAITSDVKSLVKGYPSVGVPGSVMGLNTALRLYGTMSLQTVMSPAIALAKNGFVLNKHDAKVLAYFKQAFKQQKNIAAVFMPKGALLEAGDKLIQPNLANTLTLIAKKGTRAFYHGKIAEQIVKASQSENGLLSLKDFANYSIEIKQPIVCYYRGYEILTNPPPGSGVTVCEILNILSGYPLEKLGFHSAMSAHYNIEAMRYAFADRNQYLGDPDFVKNPVKKLISLEYANSIRKKIRPFKAGDSKKIGIHVNINHEKNSTSAYSVIDQKGNAVAVTYTLNGFFGSVLIAGNTGFFLNNELDDFSIKKGKPNQFGLVHGQTNTPAPNKRPLSSINPTIMMKEGQVYSVFDASGGPTIITTIVEAIENLIDYHMDLNAAINSPRFHMQWMPDKVYIEPFAFSKDTMAKLYFMGYHFQQGFFKPGKMWGNAQAVLQNSNKMKYGASDNRCPGGLAEGG